MKTKNQKIGIIYCRVASISNGNHFLRSIKDQEAECRKLAKHDGVKIVETIVGAGESGIDVWRESLVRLSHSIKAENVGAIYVSSLDRLTRDGSTFAFLEKALNATVRSAKGEMDTPEIRVFNAIMAHASHHESEAMSLRVKRGLEARKQRILQHFPRKCGCGGRIVREIKRHKSNGKFCEYVYTHCVKCKKRNRCSVKKVEKTT